jgi:hypothetical protein
MGLYKKLKTQSGTLHSMLRNSHGVFPWKQMLHDDLLQAVSRVVDGQTGRGHYRKFWDEDYCNTLNKSSIYTN